MGSSDVSAGDTILASQQNDLRDDIIQQFTAADQVFVSTGNDVGTVRTAITQALATAGTSTVIAGWTPLRVKQAIDALSGSITEAVKGDMLDEGSGNADRYVSPEIFRQHPGTCKAWVSMDSANPPNILDSHNVSGIGRTSTGVWTCTIDDDMVDAKYAIFATAMTTGGDRHAVGSATTSLVWQVDTGLHTALADLINSSGIFGSLA